MREILLAGQASRGSREALEKLIRLYYDKIYNYIFYRVTDGGIAEELTQEVFLKLSKSIGNYVPTASFSAFIYRIAHNTLVDHYRITKRKAEFTEEITDELKEKLAAPQNLISQAEIRLDVRSLLYSLTPEQRECIILYYMQGLSYREISEVLEIPIPTAKSRVRRGLAECRKRLEAEEYEFYEQGNEQLNVKERITKSKAISDNKLMSDKGEEKQEAACEKRRIQRQA